MRTKKYSILLLLTVFLLPANFPALATENTPAVLSIRPESLQPRIPSMQSAMVRDPFNWPAEQVDRMKAARMKASEVDPFSGLSLSGIMWDQKRPLAIINGKLIGAGDRINSAYVEEITKETVLLSHGEKTHLLEFQPFLLELTTD